MNPQSDARAVKIQAAVLRKRGGPLKIESIEMDGPRDDEVLVRLVASGICHTDIAFREQWVKADGAVVLGHEGAGVVERVGKRVKSVKPGDHVVLSYQSCGRCPSCRRRRPAECDPFRRRELRFPAAGWEQCIRAERRTRPLLRSVFVCHPLPCHRTQSRQGLQRSASGGSGAAWVRHCRPGPAR